MFVSIHRTLSVSAGHGLVFVNCLRNFGLVAVRAFVLYVSEW